jgi:DsbC/DsbD-like thiol-disulfide interchange protein
MRQKFLVLFMACVAAVFAVACSNSNTAVSPNAENKPPQATNTSPNLITDNKIAPSQALNISVAQVNIKAGGSADAVVTVKIADGYHVNANPPSEPALKPTEVEIAPSNGIASHKATYPTAITKKFPFSEKPLAVYEKQAIIRVKLKAAGNAAKGMQTINGVIRYQACDDEVCYPPTKLDLMIPININ